MAQYGLKHGICLIYVLYYFCLLTSCGLLYLLVPVDRFEFQNLDYSLESFYLVKKPTKCGSNFVHHREIGTYVKKAYFVKLLGLYGI